MNVRGRSYRYVGPADLKAAVGPDRGGHRIGSAADFTHWIAERTAAELLEPFTFVVSTDGMLRLAPRRSEHIVREGDFVCVFCGSDLPKVERRCRAAA
ncbi:hypothetical protein ACH4TM_09060 [Streptomyces parvus]|uniref:hypothetical protein n=1 Tax=Streptomyces parvus TaxID=66428 RepID=UPI00379C09EF